MPTLFSSGLGDLGWCHIPWSLSRLGSQGWTLMGLRELGRMYQQMSLPWTCSAWSPLDGTTSSRSRQALQKLNQANCTQRRVDPLVWKSFERSPGLHISWWWGSHLYPPSLQLPHLQMTAPSM